MAWLITLHPYSTARKLIGETHLPGVTPRRISNGPHLHYFVAGVAVTAFLAVVDLVECFFATVFLVLLVVVVLDG